MTPQMSQRKTPVRVAIVGCGAVTESFHLPVLAGHEGVVVTALVDSNVVRATELAGLYKVPNVFPSADSIDASVADAALVATPAFLHASGSIALMQRGLHVLVEKPMALTLADAERMVSVARQHGVVLTVGLFRRLLPVIRLFRAALDAGQIGDLLSVDAEVGDAYGWQLTTMSGMQRERAGGGILVDMGPHVLDLLVYLCGGVPTLLEYADNASNGIETDCVITLGLARGRAAVPVRVELSRTRKLRNSIRVEGSDGVLEWIFGERSRLLVNPGRRIVDSQSRTTRPVVTEARWGDDIEQMGYEGFRAQIDDWLHAINGTAPAELSGHSVLPSVQLIEECYARRVPLEEPWFAETLPRPLVAETTPSAPKRRVLVTGASGFIGCRLVEWLHYGSSWQPRALIRNPGRAARLARMPIEFAIGDLGSPSDLAKALEGCETVVHAAVGNSWRESERIATTVTGTKNLVDAALRAGVKRFVYLSTIALYGDKVTGTITEETPARPQKGWEYAESKNEAEQVVLEAAAKGLPAVVLRVAVVYGPHNLTIVARPLEQLLQNRLVLVDCRNVPSNTIYVDNLCEGIRLALEAPAQVNGETFLLSDDDGFTWGDYFGYFADELGVPLQHRGRSAAGAAPDQKAPSMSKRLYTGTRDLVTSSEVKQLARRIYNSDPWGNPARWFVETFPRAVEALAARVRPPEALVYRPQPPPETPPPFIVDPIAARVSADKAERILGFRPVVLRRRAMELTLAWARYARIVPSPSHEEIAADR